MRGENKDMNRHVEIKELNESNWYDCCLLKLSAEQELYMEPNAVSIAQSKFESTLKCYAIYYDETIVGFMMFNSVKEELDGYWIYRMMIDHEYQGKGIGKSAMGLLLEDMKALPDAAKLVVGYHPENIAAHKLYEQLGFIDQGDRFGKEMAVIKYL